MNFYQVTSIDSSLIIPSSGVPLTTTKIRGFNASTLISFIDLTTTILENNPVYNTYEVIVPSQSTSYPMEYVLPKKFQAFPSGSIIVTDRYTNSSLVDFTLPLYYQYQFMYDSHTDDPMLQDASVIIRKNMSSVVNFDNYVFETRLYNSVSGRYNVSSTSGFLWGSSSVSGNVTTARVLLPIRGKDNFYTVEYSKYYNKSITPYYNELISEQKLYSEQIDYTITPSSIIVPSTSRLASGVQLFVQRDPFSYISIKKPMFTIDTLKTKPWSFQVNCGNLVYSSGVAGGYAVYNINNPDSGTSGILINDEIPSVLTTNILKVGVTPLYNSGTVYPSYDFTTTISGSINGTSLGSYITSVDYNNGYIYLNKQIQSTDSIVVSYRYDDTKTIIVSNVDLNPRNTKNAVVDIADYSIGLALAPSGTKMYNTSYTSVPWSNIAYFNLASNPSGVFEAGLTSGYALRGVPDTIANKPLSGILSSGALFLGFFSMNTLSSNMLSMSDVRRTGGYDSSNIKINTSGWRGFSDIGFWNGEAFPQAGAIIIQIPSIVLDNIINKFSQNTNYKKIEPPYSTALTRVIEVDTIKYEEVTQQVDMHAKKYIVDTIERYLPVGTMYYVVDENFKPWPSLRSL